MALIVPRRFVLATGAAFLALPVGRARATTAEVATAIRAVTGGVTPRPGRVKLDLPLLVENGNAVAMSVSVAEGPRVLSLHVFAEGNPLPNVIHAYFGPRSGAPRLATRIRLATSQTVIALAHCEDGTFRTDSVELLVTLAACIDGL